MIFQPVCHEPADSTPERPSANARYARSTLDAQLIAELKEKLVNAMSADKLYLNPKLSANDLAAAMRGSRNMLTQPLNSYRLQEFKARVADPDNDHLTLLGTALESGFNSKSSFNLIFKKPEGIMPTQYRRKMIQASVESGPVCAD